MISEVNIGSVKFKIINLLLFKLVYTDLGGPPSLVCKEYISIVPCPPWISGKKCLTGYRAFVIWKFKNKD